MFMPDIRFIDFLRTLQPEDWAVKVNANWTVKDLVAHMIGWDRSDVDAIKDTWKTKTPPTWMDKSLWGKKQDDEFNAKWVKYYENYSPEELLTEWEYWQSEVQKLVEEYGETEMKSFPGLFDWLFEGIAEDRQDSTPGHYKHHYLQLRKVLGK